MDYIRACQRYIQDWYIIQRRREVTLQKLKTNPFLDSEQIETLKLAESINTLIPIGIQAPLLYLYLRWLVRPGRTIVRIVIIVAFHTPVYYLTHTYKDSLSWPLVQKIGR